MNRAFLAPLGAILCMAPGCSPPAGAGSHGASPRDPLQRDAESYAVAACLAALDDPDLADEGQRWGGAVVERSHGPIEPLLAIGNAMKEEMARTPMLLGRDEERPMKPRPIAVMYCSELIDSPTVRDSIGAARRQLEQEYR
jgi:hypothetical protein